MNPFDYLKEMSREQLMEIVPEDFNFRTDPWLHQIASFVAGISMDQLLLALDLGTGKTKVSIDVCRYIKRTFGRLSGVVVCLDSAVEKWVDEVNTHAQILTSVAVRSQSRRNGDFWNPKDRLAKTAKQAKLDLLCDTSYDLRIISFESFRSCCTERIKPAGSRKGYDAIHWPSVDRVLRQRPNIFIIDESHKVKNKDALIFEIVEHISKYCRWRYLLTGTPFHNLLDLWAQYYILDRGATFGSSFYAYRRRYFEEKKRFIKSRGIEISDWVVTPEGKKEIMSRMYTRAVRYDESEVHDMPGKVFEVKKYSLSNQQRTDYLNIIKSMESDKRRKKFGENASMTFRQICSGFIIKTGKIYKTNPKLDLCMELVEEIVPHDKVVIFYYFDMEGDMLEKRMKRAKINHTMISGKVKDKYKNNRKFLDDDRCRVMLANVQSGSASIDLQSARYAIFYNNARSVIDRKQAIKRIHRGDIKRTRFYYDLIGQSTVEVSISKNLKSGTDLFDEVMDRKRFLEVMKGEV